MKKISAYIVPFLLAAAGIVLLFVLEPKIWGILLLLLALAIALTVFRQRKHPEKTVDVFDKAALFRDRFHRARGSGEDSSGN